MGDARREDRDRQRQQDDDLARAPGDRDRDDDHDHDHDHDHGAADTAHAGVQRRLQEPTRAKGMIDTHAGEHAYEGKGDQDALWANFEAYLEAREESGWPLAYVRDMDGEHRAVVATRIAEVARAVNGGDLLVIAELTHVLPGAAIDAALACETRPTRAQLRNFLGGLSLDDLAAELDRPRIDRLRAAYPGSPLTIVPQLVDALGYKTLAGWYLDDTPSAQVAMTLVRIGDAGDAATAAAQLNAVGRGGWMWAFHVDDALTAIGYQTVDVYAAATTQADVREFLEKKVAAREANVATLGATSAELKRDLKARQVDADEVIGDLAVIEGFGQDEMRKPDRRRAFLAGANAQQIDQATVLLALDPVERLQWLIDGPRVTAAELAEVVGGWPIDDRHALVEDKLVTKLRKRFPGASPAELFGRVPDSLYGMGGQDPAIRRWIVETGTPHELLSFLTLMPGYVPERCKWMGGAGGGWGWLDRVGGGIDDTALRAVALNCPDPAVVQKIHAELLGDYREEVSDLATPTPISPRGFEDPNRGMERAIDYGEKNRDLSDRAGELAPADVAELKRDPARLAKLLANTKGASLVRVLYLVEPPMTTVFARKGLAATDDKPAEIEAAHLGGWLRDRPADDLVAGLTDASTFAVVSTLFPVAPLEVFPQLRQPAVLARVIADDSARLEWILKGSEPMSALHALGAAGVAKATVSALEENGRLIEWFPSGALLSPRDRTYLYSLYNNAEGRLKKRIEAQIGRDESTPDDSTVDERAVGDDRKERNGQTLAVALAAIFDDYTIPTEDALTLCRERAGEAEQLVVDQPALAVKVVKKSGLSPQAVFAAVSLDRFFVDPTLAELTFDTVPGFVLLRALSDNATLCGLLAKGIDAQVRPFQSWLRQLPTGSALAPEEEGALAKLGLTVKTDEAAREVFKRRFGSPASDTYDRREVLKLWKVLERLPASHREMEAVSNFQEIPKDGKPLDGEFDPSTGAVNLKDGLVDSTGDNPLYNRGGATSEMTREQAKAAFQLTDEQLDQWVADKRMVRTGDVYTMAPAPQPDRFTGTALHEIGHAVDDRLGSQTDLIYGLAGWKQYGEADFEAWAADLGGWDRVSSTDKPKIKEAWMVWINSSNAAGRPGASLHEMVPYNHPAIHEDYEKNGVGVVALARGSQGSSGDPFVANGRAYILNGLYQMMYSVPLRSVHAAPSAYAMTAPAEYFAECYMAYYLTSDGTPKTADKKGELVAPWIKRWFDTNVDRMSFNPNPRRDDA